MRRQVQRYLGAVAVCVLAAMMLGAGGESSPSDRFGKLGHEMMCVCSCGQVLLECNHVGCPDSERMIGELRGQIVAQGADAGGPGGAGGMGIDARILNWFVAKYGATVLAAPIRGGFDDVAWIIPIATFLIATLGTGFLVRMWSQRKRQALQPATPTGMVIDDALKARIRRETEY